ncbi:MAG: 3-dehydroquinate synthase [candidate division KSB1 bacterium]|nr:3-dehydroquinate synthase [candidate division KSB1 bacterium]MDQ7063127.1 3-dehydroquinate synthase [candidate division KSB1 bacterium]
MRTLKVRLGPNSYPIFICDQYWGKLPELLKLYAAPRRLIIITDDRVAKLYLQPMTEALTGNDFAVESIVVNAGEEAKSLIVYEKIITQMLQFGAARDWGIVSLGGGVIGDLAGFVAATFMRGLPFYQVPTTLLAQVDASIGGKVAINHPMSKNLIGAFYQPRLVFIDIHFLRTLPETEIISGMAEIVKHGIIADRGLFLLCEMEMRRLLAIETEPIQQAVFQSCQIKARIVEEDEKEAGVRAILNYGHTIGHALEAASEYNKLRHGEAVFWGMLAEAWISRAMGELSEAEFHRLERFFTQIPLRATLDGINMDEVFALMAFDKKKKAGKIRLALPVTVGEARLFEDISEDTLRQALSYIRSRPWLA